MDRRAHSELTAQDVRRHNATQRAATAEAYGKAERMAAETARHQHRTATAIGDANNAASQKLAQLASSLTGSAVMNARKVQAAEDAAEVASLKEQIREEGAAGYVAGLRGAVDPNRPSAYQDAAKEGSAAVLANRSLTEIGQTISQLPPGANAQDEVYRYVDEALKGMDTQTGEFFSKRVLEGAMPMVAKKSASDYLASRAQVEDQAIAAFLQDFTQGNMKTGKDFTAATERWLTVRSSANPGQARASLFATLKDYASKVGKSSEVLRLMDETGLTDRHPEVAADVSLNAQRELNASHKAGAAKAADDIELLIGQIGNSTLYSPETEKILEAATTSLAQASSAYGRHTSLKTARNKLTSMVDRTAKNRAEYQEWERWVESGGRTDASKEVIEKYEMAQYEGLMSAIEQAAENGDQDALAMLSQRHKAHVARVGYIPPAIASGIIGAVNVDLDYAFKKPEQREAFLIATEAKLRFLFESDAAAGDGRLLSRAVGDDDTSLAKLSFLKDTFESGGSIREAVLSLSRATQPGQFQDAVAAMNKGGWAAHLKVNDITPRDIYTGAVDPDGLFNSLDVYGESNPALEQSAVRAYKNYVTLFGGDGTDPTRVHEKAMVHTHRYVAGVTAALPTADGEALVHIPNRAVRDELSAPIGDRMPAEYIADHMVDAREAMVSSASALAADDVGWFEDDLPTFLEAEEFHVDPVSVGPDGSFRVVDESGITPVLLSAEDAERYATQDPSGDPVTGPDNLNELLKPYSMSFVPNGYGQYELRYRFDRANLDAKAQADLKRVLAEKEAEYMRNAGPGKSRIRIRGLSLPAAAVTALAPGVSPEAPEWASVWADVVSTVKSLWGGAGTSVNRTAMAAREGINDMVRQTAESLRQEGQVAASLGGTTRVPEVATAEAGVDLLSELMKEHQVKRHAGIPVDPRSGRVEGSYAFRRREIMVEAEGDKGVEVYKDHKGIATTGIGINLEAQHNAEFIEENFGHPVEDYVDGRRKLSQDQVDLLFDMNMNAAEQVVNNRLGQMALTSNQRLALVSLAFNSPGLLGPNLIGFIKAGEWTKAEEEIRERSNATKHRGLQNRRNREADLFAIDTHEPAPPFYG